MPETCENWLGLVDSHVYYAGQTHGIYQVHVLPYSMDFKAPGDSKCSFIWDKGPVKIWNNLKAQSNLYVCWTWKYFS